MTDASHPNDPASGSESDVTADEPATAPDARLISDAHMMQLGYVVASSNGMDQALGALLVELVNSPPAYGILLGQNFTTTAQSIAVVADTMPADWPLRADIHDFVKKAKALYERRNGAVHGLWTTPGPTVGQIGLHTVRRWGKMAMHPWSAAELNQLGTDMVRATFEIWELTERVQKAQGRQPTIPGLIDLARQALDADRGTLAAINEQARAIATGIAAHARTPDTP